MVALERLLPEQCGKCTTEYMVDRETIPALQCSGCKQGFHQECLESILGTSAMPELPGQTYWLCETFTPRFSLMTAVGSDGTTASQEVREL